jgi:MFS family permease
LLTLILTEKLGLSSNEAGTLITILLLTQMPITLLGGKLADKYGRRKLIVVFQFLGAGAYIACGFVPISHASIYLIMAASYFYAFTYPAMESVTTDVTQAGARKEAYALLYMGFNLGFVFGPMIGGILFKEHLPWLFIGDAFTTIISNVLFMIFIKETLPQKANGKDAPQLERYEEGSVFKVLWQRKIILVYALIMLLLQFVYSQWAFELPLQLEALFENGSGAYGILASFNGFLVIVLTPLVTPIIRRCKALRGVLAGALLYGAAFAILMFIRALPLFYVSMFVLTFGEVIMTIDSGVFVAGMLPSSHRGRLNSVYSTITGMGRVISPAVIGWIIAAGGMTAGWAVISGTAVVASALLFALIRSRSGSAQISKLAE